MLRREYPNRSQAIEAAVAEALARRSRTRLAAECAKLDPDEERALGEEALGERRSRGLHTERRYPLGAPRPDSWMRAGLTRSVAATLLELVTVNS